MLRGLTTKNYSQLAARLISRARADLANADERIVDELLESQSDSTRWPTDAELRDHLTTHPLYGWLGQRRIVYLLSSLELAARSGRTESIPTLPPRLEVEHVMPRSWRSAWPLPDGDAPHAADRREACIDLLGNLTLVTKPLNASMSNSAWMTKREALDQSLLLLNRELYRLESWDEAAIAARGQALIDRILEHWEGPQAFMPPDWVAPEAESWPESARLELGEVAEVYAEGSTYLRALLDELATTPGVRRKFPDIERSLGWPRGRLASVCGGYAVSHGRQRGGQRPWHIHMDGDGGWWMWMDAERAAAIGRGVGSIGS
jgi:hypothetical protein